MKKKNKNKSLVSQTIHMFVIQSALLGIVIVTYICVSYYTVLENMQTSSRNLLQLYGKELENKLENADMLLERLIYKNNDYDMLQSEKESERYYASIEIKKFIQEQITYDQYVDAVVIGDSTYGSCMDYELSLIHISAQASWKEQVHGRLEMRNLIHRKHCQLYLPGVLQNIRLQL